MKKCSICIVLVFVLLGGAKVFGMLPLKDGGEDDVRRCEEQYYASLNSGSVDEQLRCVNAYIDAARSAGMKDAEVEALAQRAVVYYNNDMNDSVLTVVRRDMETAKEYGRLSFYYEMWSRIANTYVFMNQNRIGLHETEAMYNDAKAHDHVYGMGLAYSIMGTAYNNMRNFEECIVVFQKSIALLSSMHPWPAVLPDVYAYYGNALNDMKEYGKLEELTKRWHVFLTAYIKEHSGESSGFADVNWSYYYFACVQAALGLGKLDEAERNLELSKEHFDGLEDYEGMQWLYYMGELRMKQGRMEEALVLNDQRMELLESGADRSWQLMVLQQRAEIMEQLSRYADAAHLYRQIYEISDSANAADTKSQLTELNTIFQVSDLEMENERNLLRFIIIVASVIVFSLVVFLFFRIRSSRRLKLAHSKLQTAYADLQEANNVIEETTAAKERIESELRIARDIQMSMVPAVFPNNPELDLYASMTPAKEVGGDMYGWTKEGLEKEMLYFCVGDVSGKGVPASLFMAQATRLFHTFAKQRLSPAEIATRMNSELSEDNEQGMFITMFIGLIDLFNGHLSFCNAGHNPPVVINNGQRTMDNCQFIEMIPNAPIGLWPDLEYEGEEMEDIRGRALFVYTDGLNEAENRQQEQFSDERLLQLLESTPFESSRKTIDMLSHEVEKHRNGAEPNDDLTMMCVCVKK